MAEIKSTLGLTAAVVAVVAATVGGFVARERTDLGRAGLASPTTKAMVAMNEEPPKLSESEYFYTVGQLLERDFVDPVTVDNKMAAGSVKGMVSMLLDPESVYMNPAQYASWKARKKGNFEGIGIELTYRFDQTELKKIQTEDASADSLMLLPDIMVSAVLPGSPAEKAGLAVGDQIKKVLGDKWVISASDIKPLKDLQKLVSNKQASADGLIKLRDQLGIKIKSTISPNRVRERVMLDKTGSITLTWLRGKDEHTATITKEAETLSAVKKNADGSFAFRVLSSAPADLAAAAIPEGATLDMRESSDGDCSAVLACLEKLAPAGVYGEVTNDRKSGGFVLETKTGVSRTKPYTLLVDESTDGATAILAEALVSKGLGVLKGKFPTGALLWLENHDLPDGSGYTLATGSYVAKKRELNMKTLLKASVTILFAIIGFGFGFSLHDLYAGKMPSASAFGALVPGHKASEQNPYETFEDNYNLILTKYRRPVDPTKLKYAAMEGLVSSLGDPHTNFLEPKTAKDFTTETRGDFVGIGARLAPDTMGARIAVVFKNSPAERAGVKVNDMIVAVDDRDTAGTAVEKIVDHIKGEAGTTVHVKVLRAGSPKPIEMSIVREKIILPTADGRMVADTIGYVNVTQFAEPTPMQFDEALQTILSHHPTGLIIDLRNNPGGLLESAAQMLSRFVDGKVAVTMKGKKNEKAVKMIPANQTYGFTCPIVILINEDSASAAEIFSGCMRDYRLATLIGDHTYGKASVQTTHVIPQDLALVKVTIAHYFLPSGDNIGRKVDEDGQFLSGGIKPDIPAALVVKAGTVLGEAGKDSQLDRAIEFIKGGKTAAH